MSFEDELHAALDDPSVPVQQDMAAFAGVLETVPVVVDALLHHPDRGRRTLRHAFTVFHQAVLAPIGHGCTRSWRRMSPIVHGSRRSMVWTSCSPLCALHMCVGSIRIWASKGRARPISPSAAGGWFWCRACS
ncbi:MULTISPECIES: hypothetical protein [unclassified Nonomuraea]|uniref:hypothetical protein n=1 Tax=unclassified Nonomuraea TaxID=2593643 RepID=UPI0033F7D88E